MSAWRENIRRELVHPRRVGHALVLLASMAGALGVAGGPLASSARAGQSAASIPSDAFLTARTRSEHARHVHEALSRLLLTESLGVLSNLELVESFDARQGNVIELRTAVRVVARESYRLDRPRDLEPPEQRARRLLERGLSAGVIARRPPIG